MQSKIVALSSLCLLIASCATPYERPVVVASASLTASERNCIDYGFTTATAAYSRCVERESRARVLARVARDYPEPRLAEDARDACFSYGLEPGSPRFQSCIAREIDARRFRDEANTIPATLPPTAAPVPAFADNRVATTGVPAMRDEFGFRYDAQGNRLDARGRIISPQSTRP